MPEIKKKSFFKYNLKRGDPYAQNKKKYFFKYNHKRGDPYAQNKKKSYFTYFLIKSSSKQLPVEVCRF